MAGVDLQSHFTERNIPFGIASSAGHPTPRPVTRLGDTVIFLWELDSRGLFGDIDQFSSPVLAQETLNQLAALPKTVHQGIRHAVRIAYQASGLDAFPDASKEPVSSVTMHLPVEVRDFSDFSCSLDHVKNAGRIVVQNGAPPPSFHHFPIGYQGRASSIVVSGTQIQRPVGRFWETSRAPPDMKRTDVFGPTRKLDYEVEFAAIIGKPLAMGQRLAAADADEHIFGYVILNDWSARDIQGFEMFPLGPFNGKSFGTSISPWVVTGDALNPFKVEGPAKDSTVSAYLQDPGLSTHSITLKVDIVSKGSATNVGTCRLESLFWTPKQIVAHSVSSGSGLRTGDILATGTVSTPGKGNKGCLLETTEGGTEPIVLVDGSKRSYLEDGDTVRITAVAGEASSGVGFGECVGQLTASCV